jgi:hypothetical protein
MHKPEKLTTLGIQDTRQRQTKQKTQTKQHSTLCVGHHYAQTAGGKDELMKDIDDFEKYCPLKGEE